MDFVVDFQILYLGVGLMGLIVINILLGSIDSILQRKFDKRKFFNGTIKGLIVSVSFIGVYYVGVLVPNITINISGQELTLVMAVSLLMTAGFSWYAVEVIGKLAKFVNAKVKGVE